jgi:hypothetical protein
MGPLSCLWDKNKWPYDHLLYRLLVDKGYLSDKDQHIVDSDMLLIVDILYLHGILCQ